VPTRARDRSWSGDGVSMFPVNENDVKNLRTEEVRQRDAHPPTLPVVGAQLQVIGQAQRHRGLVGSVNAIPR
jgi:hypothetical protein